MDGAIAAVIFFCHHEIIILDGLDLLLQSFPDPGDGLHLPHHEPLQLIGGWEQVVEALTPLQLDAPTKLQKEKPRVKSRQPHYAENIVLLYFVPV